MSSFLFLDGDPQRIRADCGKLQEVLRRQCFVHLAFLRALKSELGAQAAADWTEEQQSSVVQHGFLGAFDRGDVSIDLLRRAAYDAEFLAKLVTRGAEEGADDLWSELSDDAGPTTVAEFAEAWTRALTDYDTAHVSPPSLIDVDTNEIYVGHWVRTSSSSSCTISAMVTDAAMLRLRFLDRTWGILSVRRVAPHELRIESCTGVFLAWPPSQAHRVRAAAKGASPEPTRASTPLYVEAGDSGIVLHIVVSAGPEGQS